VNLANKIREKTLRNSKLEIRMGNYSQKNAQEAS